MWVAILLRNIRFDGIYKNSVINIWEWGKIMI
jgi:hypothetical protein